MVAVKHDAQGVVVHRVEDPFGMIGARQVIAGHVAGIDRLDQYTEAFRCRSVAGKPEVVHETGFGLCTAIGPSGHDMN